MEPVKNIVTIMLLRNFWIYVTKKNGFRTAKKLLMELNPSLDIWASIRTGLPSATTASSVWIKIPLLTM